MAAFRSQKLLQGIEQHELSSAPLFISMRCLSSTAPDAPTKESTYRGVALWVSGIVGRHLTFKQISRNVVMTKVANSCLSNYDGAAFMGVRVKTLQAYHRSNTVKEDIASRILNEPDRVPKVEARILPEDAYNEHHSQVY